MSVEDNLDATVNIPTNADSEIGLEQDLVQVVKKDKGYTPNRVKAIQLMGNRAGTLVWMFNTAGKYYKRVNRVLTIIGAVLSYVLGAGGIPTLTVVEDLTNVNLGIQCAMLCVGVLMTIHALLRLDNKAEKHRWAADKNTSLFLDCRRELDKPVEERTSADKFIHKKLKEEFEIFSDAPHVPKWVVKKYYQMRGRNALPYEVIFHFDEDQLFVIEDNMQTTVARQWGEHEQPTQSIFSTGIVEKLEDINPDNLIENTPPAVSPFLARQLQNDLTISFDDSDSENVKVKIKTPRKIRQKNIDVELKKSSTITKLDGMLDQRTKKIKIREEVIDRMADMEDKCTIGDYSPDIESIGRKHDQLKSGERRRRVPAEPTAAQRFELEKYMNS